ncbi:hypothetical protein [Shewanella violacea]|uniref:Uncharacterized protein n=1 Tax=Shewanella violacea (strain JCM 10179 / CIP 106290 / LMG 19151 / DSS12) TaxID=637905 RepID=D4ZAY8_SHEVD|nr:hypothetical protein [Shewanella violacea]BAJ03183.1 hypothetical protein SVI_3212 [Shewanella violacea DSS12]
MIKSKKILAVSMAVMFGLSGLVLAGHFVNEHLANEGFEGAGGEWSTTGEAARLDDVSSARTDDWSMFISADEDIGGSASQMFAELDECSPYGLATFELSGYYDNPLVETVDAVDYASVAGMMVQFNVDGPFSTSSDVANLDYEEMTLAGNIPAWAMSATVTIDGMPHDNSHLGHTGDDTVDVRWDDMAFMTDCVADYAKVSGKAGDSSQKGSRGMYSFSGAIGTLESEACTGGEDATIQPVGSLSINYKELGYSCEFTPTAPVVYSGLTATLAVSYICDLPEPDEDLEGTAEIVLTQGAGGAEGKGKNKDRGMISVDASDDELDIEETDLDKGNVNLLAAVCL